MFNNRSPDIFPFLVIFDEQMYAKLITLAEFQTEIWLES